jgi:hypothetical protein
MAKLFSRKIYVSGKEVQADHVMGVDFAKKAFLAKANHDEGNELTVAVYANTETQALYELSKSGFATLTIEEHPYL